MTTVRECGLSVRDRALTDGLSAETTKIEWNVPDRYEIIQRVGGGKYSDNIDV